MAVSSEYEWALHTPECTTCEKKFTVLASSTRTECNNCYANAQEAMNAMVRQLTNFQKALLLLQPCIDCKKGCAAPWDLGTGCHMCCRKANAVFSTFRANEQYTPVQQLLLQRARNNFYNKNPIQKEALRAHLFKYPIEVTKDTTFADVVKGKFNNI